MSEAFVRFCRDNFKLLLMAERLTEPRKKPEIPVSTLFLLMVFGLATGQKSFHQIDLRGRTRTTRRLLGSDRDMVASDTTLQRVLPQVDPTEIRAELQKSYVRWKQSGTSRFTLCSGRKIRLGVIDGTDLRSGLASVLLLGSDAGEFLLDVEPHAKKGKELPSSTVLLDRAVARHGRGFIELLLGDPLYVSGPFWKECEARGVHVLVKGDDSKNKDLLVLQEARALCAMDNASTLVERVAGIDAERGVSYQIQKVCGLKHDGYDGTLSVALVEETRLKPRGGKQADRPNVSKFWTLATDENLTPEEMRELGHLRWTIENQGFRMLNAHMGSKATWTRGKNKAATFLVLALVMFLAMNLIKMFNASLDIEDVCRGLEQTDRHRPHAITLKLIAEMILDSLREASPLILPT